jgi:hypothetical protein
LVARAGVLPGVDVVIPAYGLCGRAARRAEAAAKASKTLTVFDFDAIGLATTTSGSNQLYSSHWSIWCAVHWDGR